MGTLSPNLGLQVPTIGGDAGPLFAQEVNGALTTMDGCNGGINNLSVAGSANVTLTTAQAQNLIQQFTGALTGNISVLFPARNGSGGGASGFFAIENATTGNFSLSVGCVGGSNVQAIPQGLSAWVWMDGTYTRISNPPGWQEITTYTASNVATLSIALPAPFRRFRVTIQDLLMAAAGTFLALRASSNGGSSFVVTSTYAWAVQAVSGTGTVQGGGANPDTSIHLIGTAGITSPYDLSFEIWPGPTGLNLRGTAFGLTSAGTFASTNFGGVGGVGGVTNAIQLLGNSGALFSATVIVEGLP